MVATTSAADFIVYSLFVLVYGRGGTEVTVRGGSLNSVAEPRITLTVVITRFNNVTRSTSVNTDTRSEVLLLLMMTYDDDDDE